MTHRLSTPVFSLSLRTHRTAKDADYWEIAADEIFDRFRSED